MLFFFENGSSSRRAVLVWRPTVAWVLEGRGELLGRDPRHATLVLGFLSCSHRRLRLTLRMSRPEMGGGGNREMKSMQSVIRVNQQFIDISGSGRSAETRQSRRRQSTQQIQGQVWSQTMTGVFSFCFNSFSRFKNAFVAAGCNSFFFLYLI